MKNFKQILKETNEITFIIGNGFNRYISQAPSWRDVLINVANKCNIDTSNLNNFLFSSGLSYPEMFSIIEAIHDNPENKFINEKSTISLRKEIANFLLNKENLDCLDCKLVKYLNNAKANIITTNFDFNLEFELYKKPNLHKTDLTINQSSIYYYLFQYFGDENGPKVWHIHGHCKRPSSLRLSLSNYTCTLDYIKKKLFANNVGEHISPKKLDGWVGVNSCLGQFFANKKLVIIGCGLDSQEILLRELLIYKYRSWMNGAIPMGYYLCTKEEIKKDPSKQCFFNALNIQVVEFDNYDEIYNGDFWTVNNGNDF